MPSFSSHFCQGSLAIAFVFSVPGEEEDRSHRPVAGNTGDNLSRALQHLSTLKPSIFLSVDRYDYRITNAWPDPMSINRGNGRSEPLASQVKSALNVARVKSEVLGCSVVILCGSKPALLTGTLNCPNVRLITMPHLGNKSLNRKYRISHQDRLSTPMERRFRRVNRWAEDLIANLVHADVA
jgi:hypothetical protein